MPLNQPINVFISYSNNDKDRKLLSELVIYLEGNPNRKLEIWDDGCIIPGKPWDQSIKDKLNKADLVLLLISANFNTSDYINTTELPIAYKRRILGVCEVVPVYIRECPNYKKHEYSNWGMVPVMLKKNKHLEPVTSSAWDNEEQALTAVVDQLEKTFEIIEETRVKNVQEVKTQGFDWQTFFDKHPPLKKKINLLDTVNCDRDKDYKRKLSIHFDKKTEEGTGNLVYFISACPTQKPGSLAQRLIYANSDVFTTVLWDGDEVDILDFEIQKKSLKTWESFWGVFQEKILKKEITFEKFVANPTPFFKKEKKVALTFKIEENSWGEIDNIQEHIDLILQKLTQIPHKHQKLVLFFIFHFNDLHNTPSEDCVCWINALDSTIQPGEIHPDDYPTLHIPKLSQVKSGYIERWAGGIVDNRHFDDLKQLLIQQTPPSKRHLAEEHNLFDMQIIEEMQYAAYTYTNSKF